MYLKKKLIPVIFIFIFSCNDQDYGKFILKELDEIVVPVNDFALSNPGMISIYDSDSGEHVMIYNHVINKLQISEFPSGKLKLNIPLEFESEKRTKRFTGGTLIAEDSIFVTFYPPSLGMINFKGDLTFEQKLPESNYRVSHIGNGSMIPLFKSNGRIYGAQPFLMDHHRMSKEDVQKQQLVYSVSLEEDGAAWHEVFYSPTYWDEGKKLSYFSWAKRGDLIYISPFYDHQIQVFDTKTNQVVNVKTVKSSQVDNFNVVNQMPENESKSVIATLESGQYETFLYDKYRDVFYRVFLPPYPIEKQYEIEELRLMERSRPKTGIMVLDADLNILSEHIFDLFQVHSSDNFLVGKEGLYVSTNNMNSPSFTDDQMSYVKLKLDQ
ncbi:hypothetical protein Belba_1566 [Belliella baltica DSM 15883]|uniref:DUF4221 domain-containing protein n=1 Tax=Belliella baltica (strain DSM 15883 / CIP 108006 / LMG 21964 / BA134) TaxID=866536 RepID=I3Z4K8_BELBD|nr:DUF4221 family protein [Belliella baltica]AFL84176.1 hypothetical protein Belba_1566 [Belliella baltica DSM 15883]